MVSKNCCKISPIVCQNKKFLSELAKTKSSRKRYKLLKKATREQLLAIAEICLNIVSCRFEINARQKGRLQPYASIIRQISRLRSEKGARKLIVQKGSGFPGLFASLIAPILIDLAREYIIKEHS